MSRAREAGDRDCMVQTSVARFAGYGQGRFLFPALKRWATFNRRYADVKSTHVLAWCRFVAIYSYCVICVICG